MKLFPDGLWKILLAPFSVEVSAGVFGVCIGNVNWVEVWMPPDDVTLTLGSHFCSQRFLFIKLKLYYFTSCLSDPQQDSGLRLS